jgi:hypothetical protein
VTVWRRWYGAGPLHLMSVVACFGISGYAALRLVRSPAAEMIGVWFLGAIVGHDLVLYPLYALLDRAAARPGRGPRPPAVNFVRVPAVLSGVMLVVALPLVLGLNEGTYEAATGRSLQPYLGRWLLFTGLVFSASALLYAWGLLRNGRVTGSRRPA